MTASSPSTREKIEQQAAVWTARIETGSLSSAEQAALAAWLAEDPDHGWVLSRYREMCAQLSAQVPLLTDEDEVQQVVRRATRWRRIRNYSVSVLAAAAVVAVAAVLTSIQPQRVATAASERRTLVLDDGSRVELNAGTRLEVRMAGETREIRFAQGEAMFQVARDPKRPFLVKTEEGTIRVTGTAFNVRQIASESVEVTVLEGSVQVATPELATASLVPGQQALLSDAGIAIGDLASEKLQNVIAWRVGQAAFENERLGDAIARFLPYHTGQVAVSNAAADLRVGGRYSLDDLDGFLSAVEIALPVSVLRGENGDLRIVARPQVERRGRQ
jgi:transmembrane sensor